MVDHNRREAESLTEVEQLEWLESKGLKVYVLTKPMDEFYKEGGEDWHNDATPMSVARASAMASSLLECVLWSGIIVLLAFCWWVW